MKFGEKKMKSKLILGAFLLSIFNLDAMDQITRESQTPLIDQVELNSNYPFTLRENNNDCEEIEPLFGEDCRSDKHCIQIRWLSSALIIIPQFLQASISCEYYGFTPASVALSASTALSMLIATTVTLVDLNFCNFEFIKNSVARIRSYVSRHAMSCLLGNLALCGTGSLLVQLCEMPLVPCGNSFLEGAAQEFCNNKETNVNTRDVIRDSANSITVTSMMCMLSFFLAFINLFIYFF